MTLEPIKSKKNKGKIYHIVYSEGLVGSKPIGSISLGSKPIVIKKPRRKTYKPKKTTTVQSKDIVARLKNATYKGVVNHAVTLKNGEYLS
jgi:hypothetical protein